MEVRYYTERRLQGGSSVDNRTYYSRFLVTKAANFSLIYVGYSSDNGISGIWLYFFILLGVGVFSCLLGICSYFLCMIIKKKKNIDDYENEERMYEREIIEHTLKESRMNGKRGESGDIELQNFDRESRLKQKGRELENSKITVGKRTVDLSDNRQNVESGAINMLPSRVKTGFFESNLPKSKNRQVNQSKLQNVQKDDDMVESEEVDMLPTKQKPPSKEASSLIQQSKPFPLKSNLIQQTSMSPYDSSRGNKSNPIGMESEVENSNLSRKKVVKKIVKKRKVKKEEDK